MKRTTLLVALAVVVAAVALPAAAVRTDAEATSASAATARTGAGNASIAPGARLSGVVGVQEAEIDGEVESRAFGLRVANAATDDAKAEAVGQQLTESRQRLETLERRLAELKRARENGSISNDTYAARAATIEARLDNVRRMGNETKTVAERLPREVLEANGVNVTAIDTLRRRAAELAGPEVAAIARTIAGPPAGGPPGADDRRRGPPANRTADRPGGTRTADGGATAGDTRDGGGGAPDGGSADGDGGSRY